MQRLLDIGFRLSGCWVRSDSGIECKIEENGEKRNILYSFISDGEVLYVGKTVQALKKRMYGYQNPGPTQTTNIRGNKNIMDVLDSGSEVEIYALPDNGLLHFGVFHVNLAAGLEDSIISALNPVWNKTGRANKAVVSTPLRAPRSTP
jgi:hypothetical protein